MRNTTKRSRMPIYAMMSLIWLAMAVVTVLILPLFGVLTDPALMIGFIAVSVVYGTSHRILVELESSRRRDELLRYRLRARGIDV